MIQLFKDAYAGHPKEIWSLVILSFINRVGTMVIPFMSVYLTTELNFSFKEAGVLVSAFGIGSLIGSYFGGRLSDTIGAVKVILISLFVGGLLLITIQFARTFNEFFLVILIASFFGESYRPALTAVIGDYVPKTETGRTMALIRLAINLGMAASPLIGGFVAVSLGYKWLFWIDGVTCIAGAIYLFTVYKSWGTPIHREAEITVEQQASSLKPYQNYSYLIFLFATFLAGFVFVQWFHTVPVFIKGEWGFDERYIGILMGLNAFLIVIIEMPLIHFLEKKYNIKPFILIGIALLACSFMPFFLPKALVFCFIAVLPFTIGEILFLPFNNAMPVNISPPGQRGNYMSWYWMTWSLVMILAPLVGFSFIETFDFFWFWIFLISLIGMSVLLSWYIFKFKKLEAVSGE